MTSDKIERFDRNARAFAAAMTGNFRHVLLKEQQLRPGGLVTPTDVWPADEVLDVEGKFENAQDENLVFFDYAIAVSAYRMALAMERARKEAIRLLGADE